MLHPIREFFELLAVAENGSTLNGNVTILKQVMPARVYDAAKAHDGAPPAAPAALILDDQETAIVLAGLRMIQRLGVQPPEEEVATNDGEFEELGDDAIDALCERINMCPASAPLDLVEAASNLIGQDDRALEEGWCLIEGAGGLLVIEANSDSDIFSPGGVSHDDKAEEFVRQKAAEGNAYHITALARVTASCPDPHEYAARLAGWSWDDPAQEYRLNDSGDGCEAVDNVAKTWRELCRHQGIPARPF